MRTIKRKISLEPYRSRVLGGLPFLNGSSIVVGGEGESNWGEVIPDIDFSKFDNADIALYGSAILNLGKMSYRSLMSKYYEAKNAVLESVPGTLATTEEKVKESEKNAIIKFVETHKLDALVEADPDPCSCPAPRKEETENVVWVKPPFGEKYTIPRISLTLGLTQTATLVGSYTMFAKAWVPGKRYYIGDICVYDNQVYELSSSGFLGSPAPVDILSSGTEETKSLFAPGTKLLYYSGNKNDDVPEWAYAELSTIDELIVGGYPYAKIDTTYYERPYWNGAFNEKDKSNSEIYFDVLDENGNIDASEDGSTKHWKLRTDLTSLLNSTAYGNNNTLNLSGTPVEFVNDTEKVVEVAHESRLDEFTRRKRSIDDDGNTLPGYLVSTSDSSLALIYSIGSVTNISSEEDAAGSPFYMGDFLKTVSVYSDYTLENLVFSVESDANFVAELSKLTPGFGGIIEFSYYLGVKVKENDAGKFVVVEQPTSASEDVVKYTDRYWFTLSQTDAFQIDGQEKTCKYADIDYNSGSEYTTFENLYNLMDLTKLSTVTYHTLSSTDVYGKSSNFVNSPFIMEDYKLGISYIENNAGKVIIDRGNAAAFERHLRLSENKTIQDLEQYGNNFFSLKK